MPERLLRISRGEIEDDALFEGSIAVVTSQGKAWTEYQRGQPEMEMAFFRSSAKPIQALTCLLAKSQEAYQLSPQEIAIMCGSHSGETFHLNVLDAILQKTMLCKEQIKCGTHPPLHKETREALIRQGFKDQEIDTLHHNCSGNHIGLLLAAKQQGLLEQDYRLPSHPVQKQIVEILKKLGKTETILQGIDGCGIPVFGLSLTAMATSYALLVEPSSVSDENLSQCCHTVVRSMIEYPEFVGGTDRLDTDLMARSKRPLIAKCGAAGVYTIGILPSEESEEKNGIGVALKMTDGDQGVARDAVVLSILEELNHELYLFDEESLAFLKKNYWPRLCYEGQDIAVYQYIKKAGALV